VKIIVVEFLLFVPLESENESEPNPMSIVL